MKGILKRIPLNKNLKVLVIGANRKDIQCHLDFLKFENIFYFHKDNEIEPDALIVFGPLTGPVVLDILQGHFFNLHREIGPVLVHIETFKAAENFEKLNFDHKYIGRNLDLSLVVDNILSVIKERGSSPC